MAEGSVDLTDCSGLTAPEAAAQVMEKSSAASPMRLHHSSRLRRSFERVKAQVDIDLLHFRRDLVTLLGTISDEEGMCVLPR